MPRRRDGKSHAPRFTKAERGAIRAALRAKGENAQPSYRELARQFKCSAQLLVAVHARMKRQAALPGVSLSSPRASALQRSMVASLVLREAIARGNLPEEYSTVTKEEAIAHLSFYFRQGPDIDRFGQTRWREYLALTRELMVAQGAYERKTVSETERKHRDLDELPIAELRRLQQESSEAAAVIGDAIRLRASKPWERHDLHIVEGEVEEASQR